MSLRRSVGWLLSIAGLCAVAIPFQHPGGTALGATRNLLWGALSLALGAFLVRSRAAPGALATWLPRAGLLASPLLLFVTLYATLAELEEVVVLRAPDASGAIRDLRLWVVDHDGAAWVTMPEAKADAHGLVEARVELVREGRSHCVVARRSSERADTVRIHRLRHAKYAVQRLATAIGLFGEEPGPDTVALALTACPAT